MNLEYVATVIAPIAQAIAATLGAISLVLLWRQVILGRDNLSMLEKQIELATKQIENQVRQTEQQARQVELTVEQMRQQNVWNRISAQHMLLSVLPSPDAERELWKVVEKYAGKSSWKLPLAACDQLYDALDDWVTIKTFVNGHERLCAAISANSLDEDYAYSVHGAKVIDTYKTFEHYIDYIRKKRKNASIYLELEKVATRWMKRADEEQALVTQEQEALQASRGTKKAVG